MVNSLHHRFARDDEIGEAARLVGHSFPGAVRQAAWWEEQLRSPRYGGGPDTLWIGAANGRIIAACQLHPLQQWIGGERLRCTGIGGVAIAPTHRKRGLAAELVASGLRAARARGDVVSALYPFRTTFYQRLGYGSAGVIEQYRVPPGTLPTSPARDRVELLDSDALRAEAHKLYEKWAPTQNGQLERSARMWSHLFTSPDRVIFGYRGESGALEGYALVTYRTDLPPDTRFLEVDELVWTTAESRRGLYGWLASLDDQWQQLLLRAPPSHRLADWIREPRLPHAAAPSWGLWGPAATLLLGPMFRIVDVPAAWQQRRTTGPPLRVAIELTDAQIAENNGRWRLTFEDGRTTVDRDEDADLSLRCDVSTLSRIYCGALSASNGYAADLILCDRVDRLPELDAVLALPDSWLFDRF